MSFTRTRRGSVLLLVVGLLTIVAMLGATFLLAARFNAKTIESVENKFQADDIARGAVAKLIGVLYADKHLGSQGPYTASGTAGPAGWLNFIDYPYLPATGAGNDVFLTVRPYSLADSYKPSRLMGIGETANADADADGDGGSESFLIDTGARTQAGDVVYIAVQVEDLSGKFNVNIAGDPLSAQRPVYDAPVLLPLSTYLGASFAALTDGRYGGATALAIHQNVATQLLTPEGAYLPFSIGDEMFLRCLPPKAIVSAGRLHDALGAAIPATTRRQLTTFNCSSSLLRRHTAAFPARVPLTVEAMNIQANRDQLFTMLRDAGATPDEAGHFVANLWAYLTPANQTAGKTFAHSYDPTGGANPNKTVYGVLPQPFITEALARFKQSTAADPNAATNEKWFAAVELFWPFAGSVNLDGYKLSGVQIPSMTMDAANRRRVFYNSNLTDGEIQSEWGIAVGGWTRVSSVKFYGGGTVSLTRTVGAVDVPCDRVSAGNLGHAASAPDHESQSHNARRDDDLDRARYAVAEWHSVAAATHTLGAVNNVATTSEAAGITFDECYGGFRVDIAAGSPPSIGYLADVYVTGPVAGGTVGLPQSLVNYKTALGRGRVDWRGGGTVTPDGQLPSGGQGANRRYPDVPWQVLLGEMLDQVPGDTDRLQGGVAAGRVYGRININTADPDMLLRLPWPATVGALSLSPDILQGLVLPLYVMAYRDKTGSYSGGRAGASGITSLRTNSASNLPGFLTPGEIAIPLSDLWNALNGWNGSAARPAAVKTHTYAAAKDLLYKAVANYLCVNSDTYSMNILVQVGKASPPKFAWRYVAVIDRSNCWTDADLPALILFSEVK